MPGIMLRGFIRATGKAAAQYALQRQAQQQNNSLLGLAAIAVSIGSVVTESADERSWRTLPARIAIARGKLPPGTHMITLGTPAGPRSVQVNISGRYTFISLRLIRGRLFPMLPEAAASEGAPRAQAPSPLATTPNVEKQSN
jgi:hypothetical protein